MRDIQSGPSEYKLGARNTHSDIHFQAISDFSVAEVSSWTQTNPHILRSGALKNIHKLFRGLVSDPDNIGINYQRQALASPPLKKSNPPKNAGKKTVCLVSSPVMYKRKRIVNG